MSSPNGYAATLNAVKHKREQYNCGSRPRGQTEIVVMGNTEEACFFDGYWNCNLFPGCDLCGKAGEGSCRTPPAVRGRYLDVGANSTEAEAGGAVFVA
jgi:hypothetical protein